MTSEDSTFELVQSDSEANRKLRLLTEIAQAGGERVLTELSEDERETWNAQALTISYIREHGNPHKAVLQAGYPISDVEQWFDHDVLDFKARRSEALASVGWKLHTNMLERSLKGERVAASVVLAQLRVLLPDFYTKEAPVNAEAKRIMDRLRDIYTDFDAKVEAAAEVRAQAKIKEILGADADEAPVENNVVDLLTRMGRQSNG